MEKWLFAKYGVFDIVGIEFYFRVVIRKVNGVLRFFLDNDSKIKELSKGEC